MQTTDPYGGWTPPAGAPPTRPTGEPAGFGERPRRVLRRSRTDRVGAGVAGGLGEYFGLDPVLFRVLFATAAFFGGVGIIAYLLAWAAIPEQGTRHAAVDRWIGELRRHHVPVWVVVVAAGIIVWAIGFSWWTPWPFIPLLFIAVVVVVLIGRREHARGPGWDHGAPPVDLTKPAAAAGGPSGSAAGGLSGGIAGEDAGGPEWLDETRRWIAEAKQAGRLRRSRSRPVLITTLIALVVTLGCLALSDALTGIVLPVYFWVTGGIVLLGLLVGVALRRTPWSISVLLLPAIAGMIAFGTTGASLHDGAGQQDWVPTTPAALAAQYRLAFGQGTLDLRQLGGLDTPRTIKITMAAGQLKVLLPATLNATVDANVRIGEITVDGTEIAGTHRGRFHRMQGYDIGRMIVPPAGATGPALTIEVHVADGQIEVEHAG